LKESDKTTCQICGRNDLPLTTHHLIPLVEWRRLKRRGKVKGSRPTITTCLPCQRHIHAVFTNKELATEYNTAEKIRNHPIIQEFIKWINNKRSIPLNFKAKWIKSRKHY
jgi:epoxyqueuosine reductase QueG